MKSHNILNSLLALIILVLCSDAIAQHSHGRRNTIELEYESNPTHDEVLKTSPEDILLRFNDYVRLVKLTLSAEDTLNVPIDFEFSNSYSKVFIQELPKLRQAAYYTVEWAALNPENIIVYGFFCFSFGPDARVPTTIINARNFPDNPIQRENPF